MILRDKLRKALGRKKANVFLRADFEKLGSDAQLSRALRNLVDEGAVVKIGVGVYAKAKRSALSGKPIPVEPVEFLAPKALKKLGVKVYPSRRTAEYNAGQTTQIPAGVVINTGNRRISRKLGFGQKTIEYENNYNRPTGVDRRPAR
ncbi:type IV toxin-antitoxin system AbiEi family antitoxin domain-containing protein [Burkholderia pseudomallei]|nr:type IV toxin-antitoxin system AbiEi family antitoxin domain-containing protein [Burkholderia pseudomallei]